jgi:ABC-type branched-subunit amino acid transport system substrate-binding protein
VSSDIEQSNALADVAEANGDAGSMAIVMAQDVYTAGIAGDFKAAIEAKGHTICSEVSYDRTATTTFADVVSDLQTSSCGAVAVFAYNADGASILEQLSTDGYTGQVYGSDGIASVTLADALSDNTPINGVIASNPGAPSWVPSSDANPVQSVFPALWAQYAYAPVQVDSGVDSDGDGVNETTTVVVAVPMGQFAESAFDASVIMALSAFAFLAGQGTVTAAQAIQSTGQNFNGASGTLTFQANGDVAGSGYCIGTFTATVDTVSFDCNQAWVNGVISDQPASA